jgi:hypothetical protein
LYVFLSFFWGCHVEEDTNDPVVEFIDPEEHAVINLPDTLEVRVHITDNMAITNVILNLVDENNIPAISGRNYYPDTNDFNLVTSLVLDDKSMETGTYRLQVVAYDGANSKIKYRDITINEIPAEILAYLAVTAPVSFQSALIRIGPDFETDMQLVITQAHRLSAVQGLWEKFFFISDEPSVLTAYDPINFEEVWKVDAAPPRALFTGIFPDKELVFSTANGDVGIISDDGNVVLRTPTYADKTVKFVAADDTYIYAAHQSLSGDINQLTVYYRVSGSIRVQELLSAEILSLVPVNKSVMIFFDASPDIGIMQYDPEDFVFSSVTMLTSENLHFVEKISDNILFLVTDRCVISYNIENSLFTDFTKQPYDFCRYDKLNDAVFLVKDNAVSRFDRINGNLLKELSFSEEVLDFQILYNK